MKLAVHVSTSTCSMESIVHHGDFNLLLCVQVYQPSTGEYIYYDKWYGRSIREDTALLGGLYILVCDCRLS